MLNMESNTLRSADFIHFHAPKVEHEICWRALLFMKPDFTSFRRLADENVVSVGKPHTSNVYVDNF